MGKSDRPVLVAILVAMVALISMAAVVPDSSPLPAWGAMPDSGSKATTVFSTSGGAATPPPDTPPRCTGHPVVDPQADQTAQPLPPPAPTQTLPHGATKIFGD